MCKRLCVLPGSEGMRVSTEAHIVDLFVELHGDSLGTFLVHRGHRMCSTCSDSERMK